MRGAYRVGDAVIHRVTEVSSRPDPRALNVVPAPRGESYRYELESYCVVLQVRGDGHLVLSGRHGAERLVREDSPEIRRPRWWERLRRRWARSEPRA